MISEPDGDAVASRVRSQTIHDIEQWIRDAQNRITFERTRFRRLMVFVLVGTIVVAGAASGLVVLIAQTKNSQLDAREHAIQEQLVERGESYLKRIADSADALRRNDADLQTRLEAFRADSDAAVAKLNARLDAVEVNLNNRVNASERPTSQTVPERANRQVPAGTEFVPPAPAAVKNAPAEEETSQGAPRDQQTSEKK